MWLSALLFGSVVDFMAEQLKSQVEDGMNSQAVTEQVSYQGESIQFTHRLWRVEPASVCADKRGEPQVFSRCHKTAVALFRQQCEKLSKQPPTGDEPTQGSQRAMYCAAFHDLSATTSLNSLPQAGSSAVEARLPAVSEASLTEASSPAEQLEDELRQCKRLTVLAWISKEPARQAERDKACAAYDRNKSQSHTGQQK